MRVKYQIGQRELRDKLGSETRATAYRSRSNGHSKQLCGPSEITGLECTVHDVPERRQVPKRVDETVEKI